jgi:hypothetical protein
MSVRTRAYDLRDATAFGSPIAPFSIADHPSVRQRRPPVPVGWTAAAFSTPTPQFPGILEGAPHRARSSTRNAIRERVLPAPAAPWRSAPAPSAPGARSPRNTIGRCAIRRHRTIRSCRWTPLTPAQSENAQPATHHLTLGGRRRSILRALRSAAMKRDAVAASFLPPRHEQRY